MIFNVFVGIAALFTGKTGDIITMSVFGALLLYIISMLSLFALRKKHPKIPGPFKVPMYPVFPAIAWITVRNRSLTNRSPGETQGSLSGGMPP